MLWVLKSVYVRVLEDRRLLAPGRLLDPEAQQLFEKLAPNLGETAFLRWIYKDLASTRSGVPELFSPQPAEVALPSDELSRALIREILYEADGLLSLGQRGEKLYGRKNFFELYAVFTAPPVMRVQHGKEDVGYIQALFVSMHDASKGPLCFRLSGRAWEVGQINYGKGVLHVRPADYGRVPSWLGLPGVLSNAFCQGMLDVLLHEKQEGAWLSKVAAAELAAMRDSYDGVLEEGTAPLEEHPDGVQWHTFAGGAVNRLLAAGLEQRSGKKWVAGNLSLRCKDIAFTAAGDAIRSLADLNWERVAEDAAREMARGMLSKFQPCLPEEAAFSPP